MRVAVVTLLCSLLAATADALPPVQIGVAFDGADATQSAFVPPDTMGAAGDEEVVVLLNGRYSVFRKSDGQLLATRTLDQFWSDAGVPTGHSYDPRIVYDAASQRWFALSAEAANSPNAAFLVAVSKSSDPTDGFTGFRVDADATDQTWGD